MRNGHRITWRPDWTCGGCRQPITERVVTRVERDPDGNLWARSIAFLAHVKPNQGAPGVAY